MDIDVATQLTVGNRNYVPTPDGKLLGPFTGAQIILASSFLATGITPGYGLYQIPPTANTLVYQIHCTGATFTASAMQIISITYPFGPVALSGGYAIGSAMGVSPALTGNDNIIVKYNLGQPGASFTQGLAGSGGLVVGRWLIPALFGFTWGATGKVCISIDVY